LNFYRKISQSRIVKDTLILIGGTGISQIIPVLASLILTRLYQPEDFGLLALYVSLLSITGAASTGRYELAIMLPKSPSSAVYLVYLSSFVTLTVALVFMIACVLFSPSIATFLNNQQLTTWLYILPLSILFFGVNQTFVFYSNRLGDYKTISINKILKSSSVALVKIGLGLAGLTSIGLILGNIVGAAISVSFLVKTHFRSLKNTLRYFSLRRMIRFFGIYRKFPKYDLFSAVLNATSLHIPILLLSYYFNDEITGYYSLAHIVLSMPVTLVSLSTGQVFYENASKILKNSKNLHPLMVKIFTRLVLLGGIIMLILGLFGVSIFSFVFGPDWSPSGAYARVMSPWLFMVFITMPFTYVFSLLQRQKLFLILNSILFAGRFLVLVITSDIYQNDLLSIASYSLYSTVIFLIILFIIFRLIHRIKTGEIEYNNK
jgi:O-antigen/teichoic acid export membrane protein